MPRVTKTKKISEIVPSIEDIQLYVWHVQSLTPRAKPSNSEPKVQDMSISVYNEPQIDSSIRNAWAQVVQHIQAQDKLVYAQLHGVVPIGMVGQTVVLLAPKGDWQKKRLEVDKTRRLIEAHLSRVLGKECSVSSTIEDPKEMLVSEILEREQASHKQVIFSIDYSTRQRVLRWQMQLPQPSDIGVESVLAQLEQCIRLSKNDPINISPGLWIFQDYCYEVQGNYSDEQFRLLILEQFDKERRYFEKLKQKFDSIDNEATQIRERIPENIRIAVWRRDGGMCARCGSREKLEYDHIVPVSRGGSNTVRNIELLCEKCNRSKGANIA